LIRLANGRRQAEESRQIGDVKKHEERRDVVKRLPVWKFAKHVAADMMHRAIEIATSCQGNSRVMQITLELESDDCTTRVTDGMSHAEHRADAAHSLLNSLLRAARLSIQLHELPARCRFRAGVGVHREPRRSNAKGPDVIY
jgi:hypothetical protein